uniref:Receptor protein serine/threonine kinase n=1 Tax=Opuntia streptacantha TaxID=393608 RepID=A0A7C9CFF8_OPUST
MLDSDFNARLGDFGLARMFKLGEKTHHSTKELAGTPGYMAPEIFHMGRTTAETDVYAFGVLALVVASGRTPWNQNNHDKKYGTNVIDWVWGLYKSNMITNAIDPKLNRNFDEEQAQSMLVLGLACCHPNPYVRPSMRNALQVLMGEAAPPSVPFEKPAFMWPVSKPSFTELELSFDGEDDNTDF